MKELSKFNRPFNLLSLAVFLLSLFLIFRNDGLYPWVFADEYANSKYSRLFPLSMSAIPNYLYLKLYSVTNSCGDGFLGCARILNAVLFSLAMPFIYLTCRSIAGRLPSLLVTLLAVIGPINSYTAYFMPESPYFLSFWVLVWFLLKCDSSSPYRDWVIGGALYAVCALVKPHAAFFLPTILLYIGYIFYRAGALFSLRLVCSATLFVASALLIKLSVGFALAGSGGVTIFGPLYGLIATSNASNTSRYLELLKLALVSIDGHLYALTLIYGLPIALSITYTAHAVFETSSRSLPKTSQHLQFERTAFLALVLILNMICVVGLFTAAQASSETYESPYRLHLRYYNFSLPLFYIVAAGALALGKGNLHRYLRCVVGAIIAAFATYAIYINMAPYTLNIVDSPEISGLHANVTVYRLVGGLLVLALATWIISEKAGIGLYLYLAMPLFVIASSYYVTLEQRQHLVPDMYDKAGMFTKQYLSKRDLSKTLIIGSEPMGVYRSLFYLDNPSASEQFIPIHSDINVARLSPKKEWLLIVGDHALPEGKYFQLRMNGFTLARISGSNAIDFSESTWPGIISRVRGLSSAESWGAWSESEVIVFEFTAPLPEKFELHLVAHAFGPNVGREFKSVVGSTTKNFKLGATSEDQVLVFDNPDRTNVIKFIVPNPVSPKELGLNDETRKLGMAFERMEVLALPESGKRG